MSDVPATSSRNALRLHFGTIFSLLTAVAVLLITGVVTLINYRLDIRSGEQVAESQFVQIADRSAMLVGQLNRRGSQLATALAINPDTAWPLTGDEMPHFVATATRLMRDDDSIFSLFVGFPNGDYLEVSNLDAAAGLREAWMAQAEDRWVVLSVRETDQGRTETRAYLDASLTRRTVSRRDSDYRANERPWFRAASTGETTSTAPYQLKIYPARGISYVAGANDGRVTGAIVLLSSLNDLLVNRQFPNSHYSIMFYTSGEVVASSIARREGFQASSLISADVRFRTLLERARQTEGLGSLLTMEIDARPYYAFLRTVDDDTANQAPSYVGLMVEQSEVLGPSRRQALYGAGLSLLAALLLIPPVLAAARSIRRPIEQLARDTRHVRERKYDQVSGVQSPILEVQWLSDSLTSMARSIQSYEAQQRALRDAMVQLIASAIDQKSPYTGGHCKRVPELALAMARAASEASAPEFRDFRILGEDQWREFEIAAWLHDCGKITTPEHIVDKGSKLEALYNRIHEVRMRFEVLLRDAEIDYWRAVAESPEREPELRAALEQRQARIVDDFECVAECNVGGEAMDEARLERLRQIAAQTWERRLDCRLGLSPAEEIHLAPYPAETPAMEPLLADKPEHRSRNDRAAERYRDFDFTMRPPEYKQNLGELHNLSLRHGTLTEEDRYLINEHITETIKMLETLPWTKELARVPEYAGGHHEKLDGTGYPRSLEASQLSIPARILAIADILEALTAGDRPYKKAKPVSVALGILREMALTQHVDPALFRLLITSGVYREYAERFLPAEQIDRVDEAALLQGL